MNMQLVREGFFGLYVAIMGLMTGSLVFSILKTLQVLILQRPEAATLEDWLLALSLLFMASLPWAVIGAVIFLLPQSFLLSLSYVISSRNNVIRSSIEPYLWLPMFLLLYLPVFYFGFRDQHIEAGVLGIAVLTGLRVALILLVRFEVEQDWLEAAQAQLDAERGINSFET